MSIVAEYRATEEAIKEMQQKLQALKEDSRLQKQLGFIERFNDLCAEFDFDEQYALTLLSPQKVTLAPVAPVKRRVRREVTYRNPYSNEEVITKGGNHSVLKAWKAQYGADVVKSWIVWVWDANKVSS